MLHVIPKNPKIMHATSSILSNEKYGICSMSALASLRLVKYDMQPVRLILKYHTQILGIFTIRPAMIT